MARDDRGDGGGGGGGLGNDVESGPWGHANEKKAFQLGVGRRGAELGSSHGYQTLEKKGEPQGSGKRT